MLVPCRVRYWRAPEPEPERAETTTCPGAKIVGAGRPSKVGPWLEKAETPPSGAVLLLVT